MDIVQIAAIRAGIYTSSQESQADSHQESEADSQQESQDDFVQDLAFERPTTLEGPKIMAQITAIHVDAWKEIFQHVPTHVLVKFLLEQYHNIGETNRAIFYRFICEQIAK